MKLLRIAGYEILKNARDLRMLFLVLLMPIVMILILGSVLDGPLANDVKGKVRAGYANSDTGAFGAQFEAFITSGGITEKMDVKKYDSAEVGRKEVDQGNMDVLIVIPDGISEGLKDNRKVSVSLYGSKNIELVETLLKSYTSTFSAVYSVAVTTGKPVEPKNFDFLRRINPGDAKLPRAIDYYSVMTMLQFLMMGAVFGVFITLREQETDLHVRLHVVPAGKLTLISGRMAGSTVYLFLISITVMLFSKFVYGANWNGNLLIILPTLFIFCGTMISLGMLVGLLVKNLLSGVGIVLLVTFFLASASGSISPVATIPAVNVISPDYYAKILILGSIYSYPPGLMLKSALSIMIFPVVFFISFMLRNRRVRYDSV